MNIKNNAKLSLILLVLVLSGCATSTKMESVTEKHNYSGEPTTSNTYAMPSAGNDIVGNDFYITAQTGDTYTSIAQKYDVGAQELMDANPGLNLNRLAAGKKILIPKQFILPPPADCKGIVINVPELRLYYFKDDGTVVTFPVALGREGWGTPLGKTYVYRKEEKPTWNVPKSIREAYLAKTGQVHPVTIAPGPENPLGEYAIYLHKDGYLIHGTNNPSSIGRLVSSGCVRMYNQDVSTLFNYVKRGTPVNILYYPDKVGWSDGKLYLEAHRRLSKTYSSYADENINFQQALALALKQGNVSLNQKAVETILATHRGVPIVISTTATGNL